MTHLSTASEDPLVHWFDQVESTQVVARERVAEGLDAARGFAARVQTRGYGRHGRVWQSPAGGLWMTVALPDVAAEVAVSAGLRVGVACGRVIEPMIAGGARVAVKWPNDLLVGGGKLCGVLCESISHKGRSWLLVGIGMNANNRAGSLAGHLRRPAAALAEWTGGPVDVCALGGAVARGVCSSLNGALERDVVEWAAARLWNLNEAIGVRGVDGVRVEAIVRGLDDEGRLVVEIGGRRGVLGVGSEVEDWEA